MVSLLCFFYCLFDVSLVADAHKLMVFFSDHRPNGSWSENLLRESRDAVTAPRSQDVELLDLLRGQDSPLRDVVSTTEM